MLKALKNLGLTCVLLSFGGAVQAADFSDPTWPCIQRKVEGLSLGLMWPAAVDPALLNEKPELAQDVIKLADTLSLRRIEVNDLRPAAEAFTATHGGDIALLSLVFDRVFNSLSKRRSRIIGGIGDFSLGQIALSERVDEHRLEMNTLMAGDNPDFDRVDALEEQIDWAQVIYTDRQRSIQYLCETPQLIEKRLFAIAQLLQQVSD